MKSVSSLVFAPALRSLATPLLLALSLAAPVTAAALPQREGAALEHLNLEKSGLALAGYDPVAYFEEGGGRPAEGQQKLFVSLRGVTYRFRAEKNRESFLLDPEKYEPAYGGWCAFAMAKGEKVEVDPESFLIEDGRLLVFYDGLFADTRKSWLKAGEGKLEPLATGAWSKLLGRTGKRHVRAELPTLALAGVDPVTLAPGRESKPGLPTVTTRIGDKLYHFRSRENREEFLANPEGFQSPEPESKRPANSH